MLHFFFNFLLIFPLVWTNQWLVYHIIVRVGRDVQRSSSPILNWLRQHWWCHWCKLTFLRVIFPPEAYLKFDSFEIMFKQLQCLVMTLHWLHNRTCLRNHHHKWSLFLLSTVRCTVQFWIFHPICISSQFFFF